MRIFLRLSHAQVAHVQSAHDIRQNVCHGLRRNHHRQVEILVIPGHANVLQILRHAVTRNGCVEIGRARQIAPALLVQSAVAAQSARYLAHTVGAKIKANAGVVVGDLRDRLSAIVGADERDHELIGHVFVVGISHPLHRVSIRAALGLAIDYCAVGLNNAFPAPIAVHGIVAATDGRNLPAVVLAHLLLQLFEITGAIGGQSVASIHEGMHEHTINSLFLGHFQERVEMLLSRMHAAVGDQPKEMQLAAAGARILHRFDKNRLREKLAILDHQVDARDLHVNDASGAHIQMADFAIAHLSFRQPDKRPAGMNQRIRILAQQPVICRLACQCDRIGLGFGSVSPAIEDDENERFGTRHKIAFGSWLLYRLLLYANRLNRLQRPTISYYCRNHPRGKYALQ